MAEYHKIPQNVTTYQGRIIGKFTAKQFIFLAVGAIITFLVFNTELPVNIKVPVGLFSLGISIVFAIVNYDGRSTDMWIQSFFAAIYATTQMIWKKTAPPPEYLMPGYHPHLQERGPQKRSHDELERYLSMRGDQALRSDLSREEREVITRIRDISSKNNVTQTTNDS